MKELNEDLLRLAMQHSPVGMALVAATGEVLAVNDATCEIFGVERAEVVGRRWQDVAHPDTVAEDVEQLQRILASDASAYRLLKRHRRPDGQFLWCDFAVSVLRDGDGAPLHFVAQIVDVTERHVADQQLSEAYAVIERQARAVEAIYDAVDVGLVLVDRSGRYENVNRRQREFMSLAYPEGHHGMAGQTGEVFDADGVTPMARQDLPSHRATMGDEFDDVRLWVGSDPATRRALSVSARSTRHPDGTLAGAALAYKDVTEFMRALTVKDEFVASVSHELRTPLTSVLGHLEMLTQREDLPAEIRAQLSVVDRNASRLEMLVSDLLYVAREADGVVQVVRVPADVAVVVREACEAARRHAETAGVGLDCELPESLLAVCDPQRLRQVADNLLSNALKYTDPGGTVRVALRSVEGRLEVEVSDTGIGIEAEDLERLFSRFYRADIERVRITAGTGLGLNIVRSIVQACGGDVSVESEVGVGSTFTAWIPHVVPGDG